MNAEGKIKTLIKKYGQSIDEASPSIASEVWLNSSKVSFIHPKGHEHGFEEISQKLIVGLFGGVFSERKLNIFEYLFKNMATQLWLNFIGTLLLHSKKMAKNTKQEAEKVKSLLKMGILIGN